MFFLDAAFIIAAFILGVYYSQKFKDLVAGVPSTVRAQVSAYETKLLADVKAKL
jgi:hypothetical protein